MSLHLTEGCDEIYLVVEDSHGGTNQVLKINKETHEIKRCAAIQEQFGFETNDRGYVIIHD
jgi:hypothetical protein